MFKNIKINFNPVSITSLILLTIFILAALAAPYLFPDIDLHIEDFEYKASQPPTLRYPFGLNSKGINILELVVWGLRPLMVLGFFAAMICIISGVFIGIIAGYFNHQISQNINRVFDILLPFSSLAMLIFISFIVGNLNIINFILIFSMVYWVKVARIVRSDVIKLKEKTYQKGAVAIGAFKIYIIYKYVLRNMYTTIINIFFQIFSEIILISAALSYLGINYKTDLAPYDLGKLIAMGYSYIRTRWWESFFPGLILMLFILSINLVGSNLEYKKDSSLEVELH